MKNVIVAVDFSETTEPVLKTASELASTLGAKLSLVHIYAPEPEFVGYEAYVYPGPDEREAELQKEKADLRALTDRLHEAGIEANAFMKEAPVVSGIVEFTENHDGDLVIVGSHGRGALTRLVLGSTSEGLVRAGKFPVLVVPSPKSES